LSFLSLPKNYYLRFFTSLIASIVFANLWRNTNNQLISCSRLLLPLETENNTKAVKRERKNIILTTTLD